jgi:DNA-binding CsgD family transcriptional regulator
VAVNNCKKDIVLNNLEQIKGWIAQGMSMRSIAQALGVSKQTLYKHIKASTDGLDTIKNNRAVAVEELENTMFKSATGYTVKVKKYEKVKHCIYDNGKKAKEWEEMKEYEVEEFIKPDTTAGIFLLKNWGNYMNEPRAMEFRKKELELKEKQVDATVW